MEKAAARPPLPHDLILESRSRLTVTGVQRVLHCSAESAALETGKGILQPGADADIVVYDPRGTSCITAADQAANVDYAPYEGTQIAGHIAEVYLRGTCVVREGKILHDRNGQYLHRGKCML